MVEKTDSKNPEWTSEEGRIGAVVLRKIHQTLRSGAYLPWEVQELFIGSGLNDNTQWRPEEEEIAVAVLKKIAQTQERNVRIPGRVYEAHLRTKKNISTEIAIFNKEGELYLARRPTLSEVPTEPYPGKLHIPGVIHMRNENNYLAYRRLLHEEHLIINSPVELPDPDVTLEVWDEKRGYYLAQVYVVEGTDNECVATSFHGVFFSKDTMPWDELIPTHRDEIVKTAFEAYCATR